MTTYPFRRRCGWCGVPLRGWQLNLCQLCKPRATGDAGIYLQSGGPPCGQAARWTDVPDGSKLAEHWNRWCEDDPLGVLLACWAGAILGVCLVAGILFIVR